MDDRPRDQPPDEGLPAGPDVPERPVGPPAAEWDAAGARIASTPQPPAGAPGQVVVDGGLYVPAGFWRRAGAFLIDAIVLYIFHQIALAVIGFQGPSNEQVMEVLGRLFSEFLSSWTIGEGTLAALYELQRPLQFAGWLNVFICMAYFTVFHGMLGATLGKLCLGLRVLRRDGRDLGYGWAWLRYLGYLIVAKLVYTAWLIPLNAERRTLYDIVLGTNVFRQLPAARPDDGGRRYA